MLDSRKYNRNPRKNLTGEVNTSLGLMSIKVMVTIIKDMMDIIAMGI